MTYFRLWNDTLGLISGRTGRNGIGGVLHVAGWLAGPGLPHNHAYGEHHKELETVFERKRDLDYERNDL